MKTITINNIFANFKYGELAVIKRTESRSYINSLMRNFAHGDYQAVIK